MKRESSGPILTTVFVDYDNIYLSLKRKSDDAAKRFAKDSSLWLEGILSGELITPATGYSLPSERRIVMNRCYGNPVPRRNSHDNSTDMNSFPFIRHNFLKSGFEVIDCPPLTAQLKNSADIRIVMDIRDILTHDTYFDEFIIMSGDADFTPVLHRLRAHARRTVVYANDHTAAPYTAISDGEIRESNLLALLLNGRQTSEISTTTTREISAPRTAAQVIDVDAARRSILTEVVGYVRIAPQAVPLETLADRAVRMVGHEKTVGTQWGGYGSFRELLLAGLPDDIHLSDTAPYTVFDANRHISATGLIAPQIAAPQANAAPQPMTAPQTANAAPAQGVVIRQEPVAEQQMQRQFQPAPAPRFTQQIAASAPLQPPQQPMQRQAESQRPAPQSPQKAPQIEHRREAPRVSVPVAPSAAPAPPQRSAEQATAIQQSIARIHEACQAPALAPAEYRVMFDVMAQEISANGLQGAQTLGNITQRAREFGLDLKRDDLRFILEVVSESDPWFEQGASANLFAGRFRNFVVARCRSQGLALSADELDLVEAWFSSQPAQQTRPAYGQLAPSVQQQPAAQQAPAPTQAPGSERWWSLEEGRQHIAEQRAQSGFNAIEAEDEFPRIVRTRLRG
jgi:NYN domain